MSLMGMIKEPLVKRKQSVKGDNSILAFCDNSSGIKGPNITDFSPKNADRPSSFTITEVRMPKVQCGF